MGAKDDADLNADSVTPTESNVDRRGFVRTALATAALAGLPASVSAQGTAAGRG